MEKRATKAKMGAKNCQAEMPDPRATTNSRFRLKARKVNRDANRIMNGISCWVI